ncbi:MAG: methyl-accepting chemotaxis protein, partial [Treponema sp.]|nr:methyl-accepting chemotaxis protein [Treponema sp.]
MSKASSVRLTLTTKLLILFLPIVLIASLTIGFISYRISARSMTQAVFSELEELAEDTVHQIEAVNDRNFSVLHSLAELTFVKDETLSLAEKNMQLQGIAAASNGRYQNIAFYDKEGNSVTADGRTINFASREYFKQSFAGKNFVSDPTFSTVTDSILQHYGVPVYGSEGYPIGALVMVISGNSIQTTISEIDLGEGMHPSVINYKTKTTVANANEGTDEEDSEEDVNDEDDLGVILNNIFSGKEDTEDFVDPNLKVHLIASYKKIADTDWTVFAVAPYDFYFKGLTQMKIAIAISTVVTILVAAIIASVLVTILTRPLKTVKHSITKIASGNADLTQRIPDATNDEIGDVVKGFNGFVKKLHGIVSNLQESKKALGTVGDDLGASAQDTAAAITEIIANIDSVHRQIVNQSAGVDETAGAVNQTAANIN